MKLSAYSAEVLPSILPPALLVQLASPLLFLGCYKMPPHSHILSPVSLFTQLIFMLRLILAFI